MQLIPDLVNTKDELISFLRSLRSDLKTNLKEWENPSLEMFLEAMAAWLEDSTSFPVTPEWRTFATLLIAGKGYE